MDYYFDYQKWLYIKVSVRKPTFSKHPAISEYVYYKESLLYTREEKVYQGMEYDKMTNEDLIIVSMATLSHVFSRFRFIYEEYPGHLEIWDDYKPVFPYKHSHFPIGSTFEVGELLIDKNAEIYYVLQNSVEGTVLGSESILKLFPELLRNYSIPLTRDDSGPGYLSKRLIGKRFKVLKYGRFGEEHSLLEL